MCELDPTYRNLGVGLVLIALAQRASGLDSVAATSVEAYLSSGEAAETQGGYLLFCATSRWDFCDRAGRL